MVQGNNTDLYGDGLKIYTTLDSRMQQYAEEAVSRQMRKVQKRFDAHWGTQAPWRDRNGKEIPRFIEELAEKTPAYQYLSHKYGNQTDSITYYLNQPHRCKVFDYDLGQKIPCSVPWTLSATWNASCTVGLWPSLRIREK